MKVHFSIFDAKVHFFFYTNEFCCTGKIFIFKEQLSSIVMSVELITVPMIIKVGSPQYLFQKWSEFWYSALLKLSFLSGNTIFLYFAFIPSITIYILLVLVIWYLCFFIIFVLLSDYSLWVFLFVFLKETWWLL